MRNVFTVFLCACWLSSSLTWAQRAGSDGAQQYSAAVALQNQQLYDLAADEWQNFLKAHPNHELARKATYYLGVCRFQQKDYEAAELAFTRAVNGSGKFKLLASAYLNLGLSQFNQGQAAQGQGKSQVVMARAVKSFSTLIDKRPDAKEAPEAMFYLAEAQYAAGTRDDAIVTYQLALRKFPRHPHRAELLYGLGTSAEETDKQRTAREAYRKLIDESAAGKLSKSHRGLVAEARIRLADLLLADDNVAKAKQLLQQAVANRDAPLADYAALRLAESEFVTKDYASAAERFEQLVERFPQSKHFGKAVIGAAKSHYLAGNHKRVVRWFATHRDSLKGKPSIEAAHWLSRAQLELGENRAAEQTAAKALKRLGSADRATVAEWQPRLEMDVADTLFGRTSKLKEAEAGYAKLAETFASSEVAPEAAYMSAFVAVQREDYRAAVGRAEAFARQFASRDKALAVEVRAIHAESLLQLGEYEQAARLWRKLIKDRPDQARQSDWVVRLAVCLDEAEDHAGIVRLLRRFESSDATIQNEASLLLASAQAETGSVDRARQTVERILARRPNSDQTARAQMLLASLHRRAGDSTKALAAISRLTRESGDTLPISMHLEQADMQYDAGDYAAAASSYERVANRARQENDAKNGAAGLIGLGWCLLESGAPDRAASAFATALSDYGDVDASREALYGRAVALHQLQKFTAAIPLLKKFVRTAAGDEKADATYVLGLCQVGAEDLDGAIRTLTRLVKEHPKYESCDQALYELAWALDGKGQAREAATTFEALATLFPESALAGEAAFRFAEAEYDREKYRSAAKYYKLAAKRGESDLRENALHKLGWTSFQRESFAEAAQAFKHQLAQFESGDRASEGRLMLAECAFQEGDLQTALSAFESGLSGNGGTEALTELAMLHAGQAAGQLKQWDRALKWFERCATQFPDSTYTREATYERARALQALGRRTEALPIFERVANSDDGLLGARARFMQGELLFAAKKFDAAIRNFFKVAYGYGHPSSTEEFHVWQADAMFEAARCCESTGRVDAAEKLYRDLIKHFPDNEKAESARKKLQR